MKTTIEINENKNRALRTLAQQRGVSMSQLVREAIDHFLQVVVPKGTKESFGIWRGKGRDGLDYERRLRKDWPA